MTTITEVVNKLAPNARTNYQQAFANGDPLFTKYAVTTSLRVAHFLAQVMHETGGLAILEENLNYRADRILTIFGVGKHSAAVTPTQAAQIAGMVVGKQAALAERVYGVGNPRKSRELGNTSPGDGFKYRGRGIMQTTGRTNYRRLGQRAGIDFEGNPDLVIDPQYALIPALLEWDEGNLNEAADRNDINYITRRINGGYNGLADRIAWFDKAWALVRGGVTVGGSAVAQASTEPWRAASPNPAIEKLQLHLRELGISPALVADGLMGPRTKAALIDFQTQAGIPADGVYGPVTQAAIGLRLAALR